MARIPAGPARPPLRWLLGIALLTLLVGGAGLIPVAQAATITVTTFEDQYDDAPPCSLREAVNSANEDTAIGGCPAGSGADTIVLGAGTFHLSIPPFQENGSGGGGLEGEAIIVVGDEDEEQGDLDVHTPMTISGAGSGRTVIDGAWPNEFETDRILHLGDAGDLTLNGVTVKDGEPAPDDSDPRLSRQERFRLAMQEARRDARREERAEATAAQGQPECGDSESSNPEDGGGIRLEPGTTLVMDDAVVDHNATFEGVGGGMYVSCDAHATLSDVTFTRNLAGAGGGIYNDGFLTYTGGALGTLLVQGDQWPDRNTGIGDAGGLSNQGEATLSGVDLLGNLTLFGVGGGVGNDGTLTIERGAIHRNFSGSIFGGLLFGEIPFPGSIADAGGIFNGGGERTLTLTNVTISENATEGDGGGLYNDSGATSTLNNVTIAFNRADDDNDGDGDGGGIFEEAVQDNTVNLRNTIIAGNVDNSLPGDDQHPDCSGPMASQGNNLVQNTAGCTGLVGSDKTGVDPQLLPLADYGGDTLTHALASTSPAIDAAAGWAAIDQRGAPRPFGTTGDIGAYEYWLCEEGVVNSVGTDAGETIDERGEPPLDVILALGGNDKVFSGPGPDRVCGGTGNDTLLLGSGRDRGNGEAGDDVLRGGGNPDLLKGGSGNDDLFGGGTLRDKGDECKGGPGKDEARGCEQGNA
ncbi:MAG: CSLREA domain-containing protein [Actinomycetota bacterium]|nr:CSLREA domain-containing protein [Actinomycetota bacterium]